MNAFLRRPQSVFLRRVLFQVHLWVGLIAGSYIFVVCLTGAALVFRIDLQRAAHPHLFTPSADGPLADAATIMESVRDAYPAARLSGVDAPTTSRPTYLAYAVDGDRFLTLLVDPVSATVLGALPERSIVRALQDLHFDLLAGRTGRFVNGIGGLCLLLMCVTGLVIWWPGTANWRRAFTVDFSRSWRRVVWDLHGATGIWIVTLIAMWALTGVYFAFPSQFRATVNAFSPIAIVRPPASMPPPADGAARLSWRELVARAREHSRGFVARVVVPATDRDAFLVMFAEVRPTPAGGADLVAVYLDQFSGDVLQAPPGQGRTLGDVIMAWVAPLHVGNFGGTAVKSAWLVLGLAPPLLVVTGAILWWTRVVRPRVSNLKMPERAAPFGRAS